MPENLFARHESVRALAHRDFRLLLAGSAAVSLAMPLQFLTQIFWIQDHYPDRSVLYVGLIAVSRGLAMLLFSLLGGAIADRFERRRVLVACESAALALNGLVAALMLLDPFGTAGVFALLVLTFLAAGNMAIDMPARTASVPAIVGMSDVSNAISLNMIAAQLSTPLSLPVAGLLNDAVDPGRVYAGTLLAWLVILPCVVSLRFRSVGSANRGLGWLANIREGIVYTSRHATIFGVIAIVLVIQVVGMPGPATLGPIWMTEVLGLSKSEFGFIAMTWGLGAFAGSVFFARQPGLTRRGVTLCATAVLFSASSIVFGHSRLVPLTAVANFGLGLAMVGTMVISATIVQHEVSDEMRGRVLGLFPLAMGLAMLSAGPASAAGQLVGLETVVPLLAWATLLLSAVIMAGLPALRRAGSVTVSLAPAASDGGS
jgi:MFS family permease